MSSEAADHDADRSAIKPVVIPKVSPDHIDWELELGVVIGRRARHVTEADALRYVAGYTVLQRHLRPRVPPNPGRKERANDKCFDWQHGKWHDTFCPCGPCIALGRRDSRSAEAADEADGQRQASSRTRPRPSRSFPWPRSSPSSATS